MSVVVTVARASVLEHVRRRLVAFFGLGSLLLTGVLLYVAARQEAEAAGVFAGTNTLAVIGSLGFLPLFVLLAALATSMGNVNRPFTSGEALPILARPVARWQYALGRLAGSVTVIVGLCALLAVEMQIVNVTDSGRMSAALWGHWAVMAFTLTIVGAMTTMFSAVVPTPVLAAIVGGMVYQVVGPLGFAHRLVQMGKIHGTFKGAVEVLWYITPKFLTSPLLSSLGRGRADQFIGRNTPALVLWAVGYLAGVVALTLALTQRKEV